MKTDTTDYEAQAQAFLDRFQIKVRATLSDSKIAPWSDDPKIHAGGGKVLPMDVEKPRHHYRVTLSRPPLGRIQPTSRLTFDFFGSIADAEKGIKTVTPYDVLACISSDAYCPDTFKEWASEFGGSEDSIKALQTYRRCAAFAKRLQAFFTAEEIEALQEIQ